MRESLFPLLNTLYQKQIMHNFRKLDIWNDSMDLTVQVYKLVSKFPNEEKYNLTSQIRRCAVSVPSNIAEGAGRNSDGEFGHFLGIANASAYELETQLIISEKLGLIPDAELSVIIANIHSLQKRIFSLIQSLKSKSKE
jgi:four helix bundle protein